MDLHDQVETSLPLFSQSPLKNSPVFREVVEEETAIWWLRQFSNTVKWRPLLRFLSDISHRTIENQAILLNLVISPGSGSQFLTAFSHDKVFDQLAASPFTFFRVDKQLRLVGYEEIPWSQISDPESYGYHPTFLHPFHCLLKEGEFSAHLTQRGDITIMNSLGLVASRRNHRWKLYDVATFKNTLTDCLGSYAVGAHMFSLAFDLSFKRHGALLVYDPESKVRDHVVNRESILVDGAGGDSTAQAAIASSVAGIAVGEGVGALKRRRLLLELCSIDGAVIFDDTRVVAVGAMIEPHSKISNPQGARTTAALSSYYWGGSPVKVSSDGQVTVYFTSKGPEGSCDAQIGFL